MKKLWQSIARYSARHDVCVHGRMLPVLLLLTLVTILPATAQAAQMIRGLGGAADFGTRAMTPNDDGSSGAIPLGPGFPQGVNFFGTTYAEFYINNNGNITFRGPLYSYTPEPFPVSEQPMIAPFWGDVDTRTVLGADTEKNNVYYAVLGDKIYVTWNHVGYYESHAEKLNAFQIVLTDRSDVVAGDFDVEFRFEQLQWTTGDASDGAGGLGGTPAQMGFDAGDKSHYYSHPDSQTAQILDLVHGSNVSEPGVWRFEVRSGVVTPDPVAHLRAVRIVDTIPTAGIDLDLLSFSKPPTRISTVDETTVIEWYYPAFAADAVEHLYFDVVLKNPQGGEQRIVNHKLELTYTDANGNPVRTELVPRPVLVLASAFSSSVATDKVLYGPDQYARIAATVMSLSEYARTIDVTLRVRDSAGVVMGEEFYGDVSIAPGATRNFTANYATGVSYPGGYTVHLSLAESGKPVGEATGEFQIIPDVRASATIASDKMTYDSNETVALTAEVRSGSRNYMLDELAVRITLSDAAGIVLFSEERPINTLLPQQAAQLHADWNTGSNPKGSYIVQLHVTDGTDILASSSTGFSIVGTASTGSGITATLTAQPISVQQGVIEDLAYTLTNAGNEAIADLPVSILIVDPATLEVKQQVTTVRSLPVSAGAGETIAVATDGLAPGHYLALLQIAPTAALPKTLARAAFEVVVDLKPKLEVTKKISSSGTTLVWLNYPWESGRNCPNRVPIERALREAGIRYRVVTAKNDFEIEIRNPVYSEFVILGDHQPLEDHFSEELREQVNLGKGLIASKFNRTNLDGDLFGVDISGSFPGENHFLEMTASDISAGASFVAPGAVLRIEVPAPEQTVGWLVEETRTGAVRHPAATVRQYGAGKVVFLAFDLGLASSNYEPFALLFAECIRHVHSPVCDLLPGQQIPVDVVVAASTGHLNLKINEIFPPPLVVFDMETGLELTSPWMTDLSLGLNEQQSLRYRVVLPREKGTYSLVSDVRYADGGEWKSYGNYPLDLVVEQNSYELAAAISFAIDTLKPTLTSDRTSITIAQSRLEKIPEYAEEQTVSADIQQNIHDLLKAISAINSIQSVNVTELRYDMDQLLSILEARWYALIRDSSESMQTVIGQ